MYLAIPVFLAVIPAKAQESRAAAGTAALDPAFEAVIKLRARTRMIRHLVGLQPTDFVPWGRPGSIAPQHGRFRAVEIGETANQIRVLQHGRSRPSPG